MRKFKACFIWNGEGEYAEVPYSALVDGGVRRPEFAQRYFIPLHGYLMEVSHKDYLAHYREKNRREYVSKEADRVGEVSMEDLVHEDEHELDALFADVSEQVISGLLIEQLHRALEQLLSGDRHLIHLIYFDRRSERECAELLGASPSAIHKRKMKVLGILRQVLSNR